MIYSSIDLGFLFIENIFACAEKNLKKLKERKIRNSEYQKFLENKSAHYWYKIQGIFFIKICGAFILSVVH